MLIRSRVIASVAVGVPAIILGLLTALVLGASLRVVLVFVLLGSSFCFGSAMFSVGIGVAQPAYEPTQYWGMETIVSSPISILVWVYVVPFGTIIGTMAVWLLVTELLPFTLLISVGLLMYGLMTISVPYLSYRYAIRRMREYTIE